MKALLPHGVAAPATAADDPRIGTWLARPVDPTGANVVLVGFPSDEGVRRNGGRPGAAGGPRAIREALFRLTPDPRHHDAFVALLERTADAGNVLVTGDLETDQRRLRSAIAPWLAEGKTVIILGGGHETSFGHFLGYVEAGLDVEILNWDAHADVRAPKEGRAHSGSPFRQALEHPSGRCRRYSLGGAQPFSLSRDHHQYVSEKGGEVVFSDELDSDRIRALTTSLRDLAFVTFDMDGLPSWAAPGVSAPNPFGIDLRLWHMAAEHAGRNEAVRSLDIAELNPVYDTDGRTALVAALTVWHFLRGRALISVDAELADGG